MVALAVVVLGATSAVAASTPRLASSRTAVLGETATIVVTGAASRPSLTLRRGSRTVAAAVSPAANGWRARVRFPAAGSWLLTARVGGRRFPLGSIAVRFAIRNAVRLAAGAGGTLLVADSGAKRIVRLDLAAGTQTVVADRLQRLTSVTEAPDGTVYATADERVWKIDGGRTEIDAGAGDPPIDIAAAAGTLYVSRYGPHVDRIDAGARSRYAGFDRPHGVTVVADGGVYVADTYAGAVKRLSPEGAVTTVAQGLQLPVDVAQAADGSLLVADVGAHRLARIRSGRVTTVATPGSLTGVVIVGGKAYVSAIESAFSLAAIDLASGKISALG